MASPVGVERVVLVVLDGLRPDTIDVCGLENWKRLAARGASTLAGTTVGPSVTAAAMASLFTGVPPELHGLKSDKFHLPRARGVIHPLPRCLRGAGVPTSTYINSIPWLFRGAAARITKALGVDDPHFVGANANDIVMAARRRLGDGRRGLVVVHLPDADRAGHDHGWMSEQYLHAARRLDHALGLVAAYARIDEDPGALLIALADHGGGGADPRNHDSNHPLDRTIPILMTGGCVRPACLPRDATLLDVPATVLWSLGVPVPQSYAGTPLVDVFEPLSAAA
ncbi:MAG TPA: alkaline phosphatase family protein [Gemmatimonadaceae bacterium]|nr:alkaline phosphatase family protein [Gemmatimonadaceae bacterium]